MKITPPIPKEHGAWFMLLVPLALGTAIAPVRHGRVVVFLIAALSFFLMRYPLATLIRTRRRPTANRTTLMRWAAFYGSLSLLSGGWLVLAHGLVWLMVIGILGGLLLLFYLALVARRREMTVYGELAGIFGLALGAPMAYYAASGRLDTTAAVLGLINAFYFGGSVFYIKLKVRQQPRLPAPDRIGERLVKAKACLAYQTAVLTIVLALVALRQAPLLTPLAFVPMTFKVLYGAWRWQDRKSLNLVRLGVAEIAHSLTFAVLVIIAFGRS